MGQKWSILSFANQALEAMLPWLRFKIWYDPASNPQTENNINQKTIDAIIITDSNLMRTFVCI